MKIFYTDHYVLPLPAGHRFPMAKYSLLRKRVEEAGLDCGEGLREPHAATDEEILRAHDRVYLECVVNGQLSERQLRRIGFTWTPQMVERSRRSAGATIEACRAALAEGVGVNLAGGTHHAFRDRGEGYCVFNDSAIAALAMQAEGRARRVAILDCDVHQGNGTASILADDATVFTFSIHAAKNFPFRKEASDIDIQLPDGTADADYLDALEQGICRTLSAAQPDLAIYLAGADPYVGDRLGRLSLTKEGLQARDRKVFELCQAASVPVAVAMAGGYSSDIADTVEIHFSTVETAASFWRATQRPTSFRAARQI
ncbi:MAG TPA: histone deacetylase [Burkholderiales bacterium]|nr:histone deacetylase [Burkholderiales bacterium]